jgi:hypothetical protein
MMYDEKSLVERFTEILINNGCTVNQVAVASVAKLALEREMSIITNYERNAQRHAERDKRIIEEELARTGEKWAKEDK